MEVFASFVTAFCAACVFIGALYIICPDNAMSKPVKYVLSLVFVVIIIAAATGIKRADLKMDTYDKSNISTEELQVAAAKYVYASALRSSGINFDEITVCTDKLDDDSIIITKVIVYSDCDAQKILSVLETVAENYEVEIRNE